MKKNYGHSLEIPAALRISLSEVQKKMILHDVDPGDDNDYNDKNKTSQLNYGDF